jgi:6-pyruvoyltetrahydropterin/6-carboxytetrahydropterin synthase
MNDDFQSPEYGMIIDFAELKSIVNTYLDENFDHKDLNDWIHTPTAENIALILFDNLSPLLSNSRRKVTRIRVFESSDSYAEWNKEVN